MPEEIEIDTESLRKEIDDELEKSSGSLLRWISLTTAILAALAAIASLKAGATVNEALVLKTEATNLQTQASDQWAYYQAKGIKSAVALGAINAWEAAGKTAPPRLSEESARYVAQQDSITQKAPARPRSCSHNTRSTPPRSRSFKSPSPSALSRLLPGTDSSGTDQSGWGSSLQSS